MRFEFGHYRELKSRLEAEQRQHEVDREEIYQLRQRLEFVSARNREFREKAANGDQWRASLEMQLANAHREIARFTDLYLAKDVAE